MPFTDNVGGSWDLTTGPDVFFTVVAPLGNLVYDGSGNTRDDLSAASLPVGYAIQPPGIFLENWSQSYTIRLYDFDVTGHDLIGSMPFTVNSRIAGRRYVPNHRIQNASINLRITVRWE